MHALHVKFITHSFIFWSFVICKRATLNTNLIRYFFTQCAQYRKLFKTTS